MKLTPLQGELATDFFKRQKVEDCSTRYVAITSSNMLQGTVALARQDGVLSVFDDTVEHANAVLVLTAAKLNLPISSLIIEDILVRKLIEARTGTDPGSPAPSNMIITPSDIPVYLAAYTKLVESISILKALDYSVSPSV